eukprot:6475163-Amphidinium_carterae.1
MAGVVILACIDVTFAVVCFLLVVASVWACSYFEPGDESGAYGSLFDHSFSDRTHGVEWILDVGNAFLDSAFSCCSWASEGVADMAYNSADAIADQGRLHVESSPSELSTIGGFALQSSRVFDEHYNIFEENANAKAEASLVFDGVGSLALAQHLNGTGERGWSVFRADHPLLRGTMSEHGGLSNGAICLYIDGDRGRSLLTCIYVLSVVITCGLGVIFQRNLHVLTGGACGDCSRAHAAARKRSCESCVADVCKRVRFECPLGVMRAYRRASIQAAHLGCDIAFFAGFDGSFLAVADYISAHDNCAFVFESVSGLCFVARPREEHTVQSGWLQRGAEVVERVCQNVRENSVDASDQRSCFSCEALVGNGKRSRPEGGFGPEILPEGTVRARKRLVRVYYNDVEETVMVLPGSSDHQITELCVTRKGLHPSWVHARWQGVILYLTIRRPTLTKGQHDRLFGIVAQIQAGAGSALRLNSRTTCLGHRASGPSGVSVATARSRELVLALNECLKESLAGVCWNAVAL